jgi:hypothetical protein
MTWPLGWAAAAETCAIVGNRSCKGGDLGKHLLPRRHAHLAASLKDRSGYPHAHLREFDTPAVRQLRHLRVRQHGDPSVRSRPQYVERFSIIANIKHIRV